VLRDIEHAALSPGRCAGAVLHEETWYSVGGGFIVRAGDTEAEAEAARSAVSVS